MLLPILAATLLTFSMDPVAALAPDQVVSWNDLVAANGALAANASSASLELASN
jgi:hypothetical protein